MPSLTLILPYYYPCDVELCGQNVVCKEQISPNNQNRVLFNALLLLYNIK